MTEAEKQQDLKKLQDAIYMDKVRRARAMTPEERLEDFFELSDEMMKQMLAGAMWQLATDDVDSRWNEVRERLGRLDRVHGTEGRLVDALERIPAEDEDGCDRRRC